MIQIPQMVGGGCAHSFIHPLACSFVRSFPVAMFQCLLCQALREQGTQQTDHAFLGPEGTHILTHTVTPSWNTESCEL